MFRDDLEVTLYQILVGAIGKTLVRHETIVGGGTVGRRQRHVLREHSSRDGIGMVVRGEI